MRINDTLIFYYLLHVGMASACPLSDKSYVKCDQKRITVAFWVNFYANGRIIYFDAGYCKFGKLIQERKQHIQISFFSLQINE